MTSNSKEIKLVICEHAILLMYKHEMGAWFCYDDEFGLTTSRTQGHAVKGSPTKKKSITIQNQNNRYCVPLLVGDRK